MSRPGLGSGSPAEGQSLQRPREFVTAVDPTVGASASGTRPDHFVAFAQQAWSRDRTMACRHLYAALRLEPAHAHANSWLARHFFDMNGLSSVGLRYFNVYGPRMDLTGAYTEVFIRWLDCADEGKRPRIDGDGLATMDFVYVADVARANLAALRADQDDAVYNVASGTETSLLGLWKAIQRVTSRFDLEPEFGPPRKVNPVPRRLADTTRAQRDLGSA